MEGTWKGQFILGCHELPCSWQLCSPSLEWHPATKTIWAAFLETGSVLPLELTPSGAGERSSVAGVAAGMKPFHRKKQQLLRLLCFCVCLWGGEVPTVAQSSTPAGASSVTVCDNSGQSHSWNSVFPYSL